jgi:hypothetical protein
MAKIRTSDGRLVDPLKIKTEDVIPEVLIHSICQLNRFTGHAQWPYSVGMHTLNLVRYVPAHLRRAALVHDWQEAWFNDLASPLKAEMDRYKSFEKLAGKTVAFTMGVSFYELEELDYYDKAIYVNERNALFPIIEERGMGDARVGLDDPDGTLRFHEVSWRTVKFQLLGWHKALFPFHDLPESDEAA